MDITLSHIVKAYGEKPVIRDVSLSVPSGSFMTLLGPSGCGKTTLLRMLAGLEKPDGGEIFLSGRCVFSAEKNIFIPPEKRGLGFVFQDFALWPHMTVFENVAFGLRTKGKTENLSEKVAEALAAVRLTGYENRYPHQLSGGQQQRVSFARAIVTKPECILFDEPLSALDALLREKMRSELRALVTGLGITAVFVTHDRAEAMSMSDRIAILSEGRLEQEASPENIYHHPATAFAARFAGEVNRIDAGHCFRPESASLTADEKKISYNVSVMSAQFLGNAYRLRLSHGVEEWTYLSPEKIPAGAKVRLYVAPEKVIPV